MPTIAEEYRAEGRIENSRDTILEILEARFSFVPSTMKARLNQIADPVLLKELVKNSALVNSIEEFLQRIEKE